VTQPADRGSKKLISLAPDAWAQWVTQRPDVTVRTIAGAEFTWMSRASDAVLLAHAPDIGNFLIVNEVQLHYKRHMPRRINAYAALAEEHYDLPVFPVLITILPPSEKGKETIPDHYEQHFMGLQARREYRLIKLWEVEAMMVFTQPLPALLPFVPVLRGGDDEAVVRKALEVLRTDPNLNEMESLLAFFATFVLETKLVQQIMRWDMTVLRESPWYREILNEGHALGIEQGIKQGIEQGIKQGIEQGTQRTLQRMLLRMLQQRFGSVPAEMPDRLQHLGMEHLEALTDLALTATTLEEFLQALPVGNGAG
jgi:predicted transposase YdaD